MTSSAGFASCASRFSRQSLLRIGLLVLFLLSLVAPAAFGQRADAIRLFEDGNAAYRQGDYAGAIDAYTQALERGYASGALYLNLGNAYYRHDELGQAVRYYLKAERLLPDNRELQHNLAIARAQTADEFARLPEPVWRSWWQAVTQSLGAWGLFALGLASYLAAMGLWGYRLRTRRRTAWTRRGLAASGIAAAVLLVAAFAASLQPRLDRRAVITAASVALYEAPVPEAPTTLTLHEGLAVAVRSQRGAWLEVELPNGVTGWIDTTAVAEV